MKFSLRALFILITVVAAIAGAVLALPFPLREAALLILALFVIAALLATGVILFTMLVCAVIDFFLERSARPQTPTQSQKSRCARVPNATSADEHL